MGCANTEAVRKKLFFLHIPKNAGSFINRVATSVCSRVQLHIESARADGFEGVDTCNSDFISGHIRLEEARLYLDLCDFAKVVVLRNPVDQLISHLNWVRRLSFETDGPLFASRPREVQELAVFLGSIDFSRKCDVERLVRDLSPHGHHLFNNCQTRYLSLASDRIRYGADDATAAIDGLGSFDLVGVVERLDLFVPRLQELMGWTTIQIRERVNATERNFRIEDRKHFEDVVTPLVESDRIVYDYVMKNQLHQAS